MRTLAIVTSALLLGACGSTSYKVAPSTQKVATKLETAKRSTQEAQKRTVAIQADTKQTQVEAKTTAEHIAAAFAAIERKDYVAAAQELIAAKASNALVMMMLEQSYRNIVSLQESHAAIEADLTQAIFDNTELQKKIDKMAENEAKYEAIVQEGEWGFGAGYFVIGTKRILSHAFWGALILLGVVLVVVIIGAFVGGPLLAGIKWVGAWVWSRIRKPS